MKIGIEGKNLIKKYEGCKLEAYLCPSGIWTIGIGHTSKVTKGMKITETQAEEYFYSDIAYSEKCVNNLKLNLNQNQFDALVSFTFNCGAGSLATLTKNRTLAQIAEALTLYVKDSKGRTLQGLVNRRKDEKALFLKNNNRYRVNATVLNVREQPNTSCKIIGYLTKGCIVTIQPVNKDWAKYSNGYISMNYLVKL